MSNDNLETEENIFKSDNASPSIPSLLFNMWWDLLPYYAFVRHGSDYTIVRRIRATLEGCVAVATLNQFSMKLATSRGCPQGDVLPLLLWCLVVDDLLARLSGNGVFIQGYTDDVFSRWVNSQTWYQDSCSGPF